MCQMNMLQPYRIFYLFVFIQILALQASMTQERLQGDSGEKWKGVPEERLASFCKEWEAFLFSPSNYSLGKSQMGGTSVAPVFYSAAFLAASAYLDVPIPIKDWGVSSSNDGKGFELITNNAYFVGDKGYSISIKEKNRAWVVGLPFFDAEDKASLEKTKEKIHFFSMKGKAEEWFVTDPFLIVFTKKSSFFLFNEAYENHSTEDLEENDEIFFGEKTGYLTRLFDDFPDKDFSLPPLVPNLSYSTYYKEEILPFLRERKIFDYAQKKRLLFSRIADLSPPLNQVEFAFASSLYARTIIIKKIEDLKRIGMIEDSKSKEIMMMVRKVHSSKKGLSKKGGSLFSRGKGGILKVFKRKDLKGQPCFVVFYKKSFMAIFDILKDSAILVLNKKTN